MSLLLTGILTLIVLAALSSVFIMAEYSLVASRRTRLTELAEQGRAGARTTLLVMGDMERFLAGAQTGITIISIAVGILAEPPISGAFEHALEALHLPLPNDAVLALGGILGLLLATYIHLVLGEIVPRSIALRAVENVACVVVPPLHAMNQVLRPFIWLLNFSSRSVLRLLGIKMSGHASRVYSATELEMLVEESQKGGTLESGAGEMISKVFSFGDLSVREVMVPRTEMICVDADSTLHEVAHLMAAHAFDRMPVFEDNLDRIVGVLHVKDLIRALLPNTRPLSVRQLMREALFVPDTQRADELLAQLRTRHEYMAVVLDEYGGTAGLATLGDLVSRIVGEVSDSAETQPDIQANPDGSALLNGMTTIGDVNDAFDLGLVDPNYDTIAGYIMGRLGRVAHAGDEIDVPGMKVALRVEEMDRLRVAKVRMVRKA
ncbi:MAG: hemolysin family protein [Thermoflexales bacterium]|nr:hemolysin family protein [Thermoflexales bacterium]